MEEVFEEGLVREAEARRGGRGRKLQAEGGRCDTRVKISEINRCWTDVSWGYQPDSGERTWARADQLCVELGQPRLTGVVEDQNRIDHVEVGRIIELLASL